MGRKRESTISFINSLRQNSRFASRSLQFCNQKKYRCFACLKELFFEKYSLFKAGDKREINNWLLCKGCIPEKKGTFFEKNMDVI